MRMDKNSITATNENVTEDLCETIYDQMECDIPPERDDADYADPGAVINYMQHELKYGNFIPGKLETKKEYTIYVILKRKSRTTKRKEI